MWSMMASATAPPPSWLCQPRMLNCAQKIVTDCPSSVTEVSVVESLRCLRWAYSEAMEPASVQRNSQSPGVECHINLIGSGEQDLLGKIAIPCDSWLAAAQWPCEHVRHIFLTTDWSDCHHISCTVDNFSAYVLPQLNIVRSSLLEGLR